MEKTMKSADIRVADFTDKLAIHDFLAKELEFPSYYGKNLDALYEVLTELDQPVRIRLEFGGAEDAALIHSVIDMAGVMLDAQKENELLELEIRD